MIASPTPDPLDDTLDPFEVNDSAAILALLSDALSDMEGTRIANENRLRQLTRTGPDEDGEERGFGLPADHPQVKRLSTMVDSLRELEESTVKNLQLAMKSHPLGPWVAAQKGVGEKQAGRLIAAIRDPYWNDLHNRPRTVAELWAYCGLHVIVTSTTADGKKIGQAPTRTKGVRANWSQVAKMRAYLVAQSCIKNKSSAFRAVYDEGREKYEGAVHEQACRRCGPSGNPAPAGSPLSLGHQHARATRLVMKEILRALWEESRRLHGDAPDPEEQGVPLVAVTANPPVDAE